MSLNTVLLTGGCGFLGQYVIKNILYTFPDIKVKVLDLRPNPHPVFDFTNHPSVDILLGKDICNPDSLAEDFSDVDAVIHLAGVVSFALIDEDLLNDVNVTGTRNVLDLAYSNGVRRFIHVSSVAALGYNDDADKPIDESFIFDWETAESRRKYYMLTKHLADVQVEEYRKKGLDAVIVYPGLLYGPGDVNNSSRLITALRDRKIPFNMPGGTNVIDVRDVARGIVDCLKSDICTGNFLLSGHNLSFEDMNRSIAKVLEVKPPRFGIPKYLNEPLFRLMLLTETILQKRLGLSADNIDSAFKFRYFDNSNAQQAFGWVPEIGFDQTIKDTVIWLSANGHI
ncbi:MAG: NAD-dependent epimerase/dehydratase family protein [Candidatus Woesearchaeota archaeon]